MRARWIVVVLLVSLAASFAGGCGTGGMSHYPLERGGVTDGPPSPLVGKLTVGMPIEEAQKVAEAEGYKCKLRKVKGQSTLQCEREQPIARERTWVCTASITNDNGKVKDWDMQSKYIPAW